MNFGDSPLDPDMDDGEVVVYDPDYGRATMRFTRRFLEALYRMPRPIVWPGDDGARYAHADLPELADEALELEGVRVLLRLACEPPTRKDRIAWLRERRQHVAAEQARRAEARAAAAARERLPMRIEWGHATDATAEAATPPRSKADALWGGKRPEGVPR